MKSIKLRLQHASKITLIALLTFGMLLGNGGAQAASIIQNANSQVQSAPHVVNKQVESNETEVDITNNETGDNVEEIVTTDPQMAGDPSNNTNVVATNDDVGDGGIKVTFEGTTTLYQTVPEAFTAASAIVGSSESNPTTIEFDKDYTMDSMATLTGTAYSSYVNLTGAGYTITRSGTYRININSGATLNALSVTLDGNQKNAYMIYNAGNLSIVDGVTIKNAADTAVYNYNASTTFTMSDGEISGNTAAATRYGGGVYSSSGTFTMSGG